MKTALIMEGGAMRGMFTCGVIDVLMEQGVVFDAAAGISAGAVFGCNFKSHQIGRPIRYNKRYCRDWRYQSLRSLITTGDLYGADFCYRELPDVLDVFDRQAFRENPMAFYVGAFDIEKGEMVYHRCTDGEKEDLLWMRASASMPLVSRPVPVAGRLLLDGGIKDPTPYFYMESLGYRRNLVILTQPDGYRKQKSRGLPLTCLLLRKHPQTAAALAVRHDAYNRHIDAIRQRERAGEALVIRPETALNIRRTEKDPRELERVYQEGRRAAAARLAEIRDFLGEDTAKERKKALRRDMRDRLAALSDAYIRTANEKICENILAWQEYRRAKAIFCYVSMGREPDTRRLLSDALAAGKRVYVPRCDGKGEMRAARLNSLDALTPGAFGIPEPPDGAEYAGPEEMDLVLVPCVSASRRGERLGHGGGYYDRFLAKTQADTVCLCYEKMQREDLPMTALDRRMRFLADEAGVHGNGSSPITKR